MRITAYTDSTDLLSITLVTDVPVGAGTPSLYAERSGFIGQNPIVGIRETLRGAGVIGTDIVESTFAKSSHTTKNPTSSPIH